MRSVCSAGIVAYPLNHKIAVPQRQPAEFKDSSGRLKQPTGADNLDRFSCL